MAKKVQVRQGDHHRAVDAFHDAFVARYGHKPTWSGKQLNLIKQLLRKHGADEVVARIAVCFGTEIEWPPHPRTVDTLSVHFDKFIVVEQPAKVSVQDQWERVERLMAQWGRYCSKATINDVLDKHLLPRTAEAVRDAGWHHLCGLNANSARFAFFSAYKQVVRS